MCIIVVKKKGIKMPSNEILHSCFIQNPDGAGMMYVDNNDVVIEKGFMTWENYEKRLNELNKQYNNFENKVFVTHFRIGTQGENDSHTCHPFPVSSKHKLLRKTELRTDLGMCHNGILSDYGSTSKYSKYHEKDKQLSDTQLFIRYTVNAFKSLNRNFYKNPEVVECLAHISEGSRLCFLDRYEWLTLTGDWHSNKDGLLMSHELYSYGYSYYGHSYYNGYKDWYDDKDDWYGSSYKKQEAYDDKTLSLPYKSSSEVEYTVLTRLEAKHLQELISPVYDDVLPQWEGCKLETTNLTPIEYGDHVVFELIDDVYFCGVDDVYYYDEMEEIIYYVDNDCVMSVGFGWIANRFGLE